MSDLNNQISKLVSEFVDNVTALARRAAVDTLTGALEDRGPRRRGLATSSEGIKAERRGKGAKRSSTQLDRLQSRVMEFVAANPGMRIEQINKELGTSTRDLQLPIRKLIASGSLKSKGEKRATTYFAGAKRK
jgi:predicted HTH transcriptional regulator